MDALTLVTWVAFYALLAVSIRRYAVRRTSLDLGVLLVFAATGAVLIISVANGLLPSLAWLLTPLAVGALVFQPVAMLRLVGLFVPLRPWVVPAAAGGFLACMAAQLAVGRTGPFLFLIVAYFLIVEGAAGITLIREARRRHGFPRARLVLAGFASVLFASSVVVSSAAAIVRAGTPAVPGAPEVVISRVLALVAALGYLAAFAPPPWLVRIAHRALAYDLIRLVVSAPTGTDPGVHWRALAQAAASILGTSEVQIRRGDEVMTSPLSPSASVAPPVSGAPVSPAASRLRAEQISIPLVADGREVATLTAQLPGRALFLEDDVAMIDLLASLTLRAVDRELVIAGLAEANQAMAEAAAVRASKSRFRALLDADPNAILAIDADGRVRWSTRSAERMFGLSEDGLSGRPLETLVLPRPGVHLGDAVGASLAHAGGRAGASGGSKTVESPALASHFETTGLRWDGSAFPAEVALTSFQHDGEPFQLAAVTDISWRREADAIRERFIGVLSHELRTPITAIFGGTQLLLNRGASLKPAMRTELLTDVAAEAERLQRMIENLLVLARVEGGAEVAEAGPVLLHRMLPAVISRERDLWPGMVIETSLPASLPPVTGDEASLSLVVRNFISNAGKYAGDHAHVCVTVDREDDGEVAVRVLDDGPGFDGADADRLFELYFRSKASRATPGSGIGLFVCHNLVAAMGGRTWARPRPEGGAEFGFTLPVYAEPGTIAAAQLKAATTAAERRRGSFAASAS